MFVDIDEMLIVNIDKTLTVNEISILDMLLGLQ